MRSLVPVALFTSTEKTQSKFKFRRLRWFCLLFSANERTCTAVGISMRAAFYLFFVVRVSAVFQQFCEGCNSSLAVISFCPNKISLYTCLQSNFSIVYFKKTCFFWAFSLMYFFSFFFSFSGL